MSAGIAVRLRGFLDGFWFVPSVIALALAGLALTLIEIDRVVADESLSFAFDGDADAARGILQTVAGSLITVAGLAFSLTVVVLVLVSGQFTPRAVPAFLADRVNQVTAGGFIGISAYCLLVLRTIRGGGDEFVPGISVTVAVALAVTALGLLLVFIHHLGTSIQASSIVNRIGRETLRRVEELPAEDVVATGPDPASTPGYVTAAATGFVRHIALVELADDLDAACGRVRLVVTPGDFVTDDDVLAEIWPATSAVGAEAPVRAAITVGIERDLAQDVLYGIRQLAEIALKALSPGINDPTTAVSAIDYERAVLERLARHPLPTEVRAVAGTCEVVAPLRSFADYVEGAFVEVGRYATANARVVVVLLEALASVAAAVSRAGHPERLGVLADTGATIAAQALEDARTDRDADLIRAALREVRERSAGTAATGPPGARRSSARGSS
jgi:uncharacterized membrane protein